MDQILRFIANPSLDCDTPGDCYYTGAREEINSIISHRDHNQVAMVVSSGKGFDGVDGWYPKAFHQFANGTGGEKFFAAVPLIKYHKTISSVIGEFLFYVVRLIAD